MEDKNTQKERIEELMAAENVNAAQFSQETGIKSATLSHILTGRNKPSFEVLKKILNRYKNVSSDWLLFGVGSLNLQKTDSQTPSLFDNESENNYQSNIYSDSNGQNRTTKKQRIHESIIEIEQKPSAQMQPTEKFAKKVEKIIVYYSDNSFQEFYPK